MTEASETPLKTYRGNCHCKAFVYEAHMPEISSTTECNCSVCSKKGYLWNFPNSFNLVKGAMPELTSYNFGSGAYTHKFCPHCGTALLAQLADPSGGEPKTGINIRSLQGLDLSTVEKKTYDGKAKFQPQYQAPQFTGTEPADIDGGKLYTGSCHCGAVTVALRSKPLDKSYEGMVGECNCALCQRFAHVFIGPQQEQVSIAGMENLTRYPSDPAHNKLFTRVFCKTCGTHIGGLPHDLTEDQVAALSESAKQFRKVSKGMVSFNVRVLNDFELSELKEPMKMDGAGRPPVYVNP